MGCLGDYDLASYNIMFGPDKCWYTKRIHLIFKLGKNVLKKSDLAYKQENNGSSHVYRLYGYFGNIEIISTAMIASIFFFTSQA